MAPAVPMSVALTAPNPPNNTLVMERFMALHIRMDRMKPENPSSVPAMISTLLESTKPVAADDKPASTANPANEGKDYEAALVALKASRFKEALAGFSAFIKNYPSSAQQPSAHFWAGYVSAQLRDYARAAGLYGKVAANWPRSSPILRLCANGCAISDRKSVV